MICLNIMIKKFWLGQTPMWVNVWIIGVVFFYLLFIGTLVGIDKYDVSTSINTVTLVKIPIYIFWGIGTWRSAQIYKGRKLWSLLTKLFVIIKCGGTILSPFIGSNFIL